jgi:hypothetical protein
VPTWTVTGEVRNEDGLWQPFESDHEGETKGAARWAARRAHALGTPLATLEEEPPNAEREQAEINSGEHDREAPRGESEQAEYERLVENVRILTVEGPSA